VSSRKIKKKNKGATRQKTPLGPRLKLSSGAGVFITVGCLEGSMNISKTWCVWGIVLLTVFFVPPAVCDETRASQDTVHEAKQQTRTVEGWTSVSPLIPGIPKIIIEKKQKALGFFPLVAIWDDGTIAWVEKTEVEKDSYFVKKIPVSEIAKVLGRIKRYTADVSSKCKQEIRVRDASINSVNMIGVLVLDRELFVNHLWSSNAIEEFDQVKNMLGKSDDDALVQYLRAILKMQPVRRPWYFLPNYVDQDTEIKEEDLWNATIYSRIVKPAAEQFVKEGDHFLFCRKQIESLIPKKQIGSSLVPQPLKFSSYWIEGTATETEGTPKSIYSYSEHPPEPRRER
jgi:hypothetical protein